MLATCTEPSAAVSPRVVALSDASTNPSLTLTTTAIVIWRPSIADEAMMPALGCSCSSHSRAGAVVASTVRRGDPGRAEDVARDTPESTAPSQRDGGPRE